MRDLPIVPLVGSEVATSVAISTSAHRCRGDFAGQARGLGPALGAEQWPGVCRALVVTGLEEGNALLQLFGLGYSWGGFESLATPVDPARIRTASPWPLPGLADDDLFAVRLSVGLEDPADLIADMAAALDVWRAKLS